MKRLFFALWPDAEIRRRLTEVAELLPEASCRRTPVENLHLTLVFLGNVPDSAVPALKDGANRLRLKTPGFALRLERNGWWKRSGIAWLAPEHAPPPLLSLVDELRRLSKQVGLFIEERDYRPHLTLARKLKRGPGPLRFEPLHWQVRDFCLVESVTHSQGANYQPMQSWALSS